MLHRSVRWGSVLAPLLWLVSSEAAPATRVTLPFDSGEAWSWTDEHFSVDLILTRRHAELVEQWSGLKENPGKLPLAYIAERAQKGEPVHAVILFRGCQASESGKCAMKLDYVVHRPDGTEYGAVRGRTVWDENEPVPAPDLVHLGGPYVEFVADEEDPTGDYSFVATIYTEKNPAGITLKRTLQVVKPK